jgi:hypothetical protein
MVVRGSRHLGYSELAKGIKMRPPPLPSPPLAAFFSTASLFFPSPPLPLLLSRSLGATGLGRRPTGFASSPESHTGHTDAVATLDDVKRLRRPLTHADDFVHGATLQVHRVMTSSDQLVSSHN